MVTDLLTMQNTNYFTAGQALIAVIGVAAFIAFCIWLWAKGPKFQGRSNKLVVFLFVASCFIWVPLTTQAAQDKNIIASYFLILHRVMKITVLFTVSPLPLWTEA